MQNLKKLFIPFIALFSVLLISCNDDDVTVLSTGNVETFTLFEKDVTGIDGIVKFVENSNNTTTIQIELDGTKTGDMHPAHIHFNTAAEGGDIALTLATVIGDTGIGFITVSTLDDGTPISYEELINYDGYINVHQSADDLGTLIAQGDIGENVLTGTSHTYDLFERAVDGISGTATFTKRVNDETLIEVNLDGTEDGDSHPAHIHNNTALEGGAIAVDITPINGTTGSSLTNVASTNTGDAITYEQLLEYDGYINVHNSVNDLGTIIAQGDIGINELTGAAMIFELFEKDVDGISGTALFQQRVSDTKVLATLELEGTTEGRMSPAHIHANTALEGGAIVVSFTPVNGTTGISMTNISTLDNGDVISFDDIGTFDGYINVHQTADDLGTLIAQGDIGINELTGDEYEYELFERATPGVSGTATFKKRVSNTKALAILDLEGTTPGVMSPAHIHANTALQGGGIEVTFTPVDGETGMSMTNISTLDDGTTAITYDEILAYDGYINVHESANSLNVIIAQGDIGINELTGEEYEYSLFERAAPGVSGTATFKQRKSNETLAILDLEGTTPGVMSPAHIHANTALQGGGIEVTFTSVDGETGMSMTNISTLDDGTTAITYDELLTYDGYINVHQSANALGVIIAQGDIGINELTGESKTYPLNELSTNGSLKVEERVSGNALATLSIEAGVPGVMHPAHIHVGAVADAPGAIMLTFTPVDGTSGMSMTDIVKLDDDAAFGYDEVLVVNGYVNVHASADNLGTLLAQGNIGANAD